MDKQPGEEPNPNRIKTVILKWLRILVALILWLLLFVSIFTGYFSILFLLIVIVITILMLRDSWLTRRKDNK